ncbi:sensor histidine kinase [Bacillus sp. FJAT-42376]|uniref:sensor histidine kinase n=1 Tax=Bacillus sp. FJAT-42376 TaxID=2014076 RepID=UPI000F5137FC|nr:sensor histidine kinase [Bacillus sp. FJAT-42376]AZB43071.1 sensor histidine kinase [Bacillus sp. FJAT-42376]
MRTLVRSILSGAVLSLVLFLALFSVWFMTFPPDNWSNLWEREVGDLPFILFAMLLCLCIGACYGLFSALGLKRQLKTLNGFLQQLESGKHAHASFDKQTAPEFQEIRERLSRLNKQQTEQIKIFQKSASEKAEDHEKQVQAMVSLERQRLARELHDSVSQQLFAASMLMSAINEGESSPEVTKKQLKLTEQMIQQSQLEMRALLLHLRPAALKGKTLKEGIEELLSELVHKVPLSVNWKLETFILPKGIEDHLFRILQESVSNTLRHAKAEQLDVLLIKREQLAILRITDDGVGFNVEQMKAGSYGLQNIKERAAELGGMVKIISLPNKGTKLEVRIPLLDQETGEGEAT